jgi:hypothetical protein
MHKFPTINAEIRGVNLTRRRRNACTVNPVFANRRRPMRLKPLLEPSNIMKNLKQSKTEAFPGTHPVQELHPIMRRGKLQASDPFGRGGVEKRARGTALKKHGEWYLRVDMAAGPGSRRYHGRKRGGGGCRSAEHGRAPTLPPRVPPIQARFPLLIGGGSHLVQLILLPGWSTMPSLTISSSSGVFPSHRRWVSGTAIRVPKTTRENPLTFINNKLK